MDTSLASVCLYARSALVGSLQASAGRAAHMQRSVVVALFLALLLFRGSRRAVLRHF